MKEYSGREREAGWGSRGSEALGKGHRERKQGRKVAGRRQKETKCEERRPKCKGRMRHTGLAGYSWEKKDDVAGWKGCYRMERGEDNKKERATIGEKGDRGEVTSDREGGR